MPVAVGSAVTPSLVATEEDGGPGASWPPGALPGLCSPARPWARRPQRLSPLGCASPRRVPLSCRGAPLPLGCASPLGVRLSPWGAPLPSGCDSSPGVHVSSRVRLSPASRRFGVVWARLSLLTCWFNPTVPSQANGETAVCVSGAPCCCVERLSWLVLVSHQEL